MSYRVAKAIGTDTLWLSSIHFSEQETDPSCPIRITIHCPIWTMRFNQSFSFDTPEIARMASQYAQGEVIKV